MCLLCMRDLIGDPRPLLVHPHVVVVPPLRHPDLPHGRRQAQQGHRHRRPPHSRVRPQQPAAAGGQPHLDGRHPAQLESDIRPNASYQKQMLL